MPPSSRQPVNARVDTFAVLPDPGQAATLDGLDSGKTIDRWSQQPAIYYNLGEALHDLGDTAALASMCDTLRTPMQSR